MGAQKLERRLVEQPSEERSPGGCWQRRAQGLERAAWAQQLLLCVNGTVFSEHPVLLTGKKQQQGHGEKAPGPEQASVSPQMQRVNAWAEKHS